MAPIPTPTPPAVAPPPTTPATPPATTPPPTTPPPTTPPPTTPTPPPPPAGPLPFYESGCEEIGCVSGAQCYLLSSPAHGLVDSICSAPCLLDSDCGTNGWCAQPYSSRPICFEVCTTDADCIVEWRCETIESFEPRELVPACVPPWS